MSKSNDTSQWTVAIYLSEIYLPQRRAEAGMRDKTADAYRRAVVNLDQFAGHTMRLEEVDGGTLSQFEHWSLARGCAQVTAAWRCVVIKSILRHWRPEGQQFLDELKRLDESTRSPRSKSGSNAMNARTNKTEGGPVTLLTFFEQVYLPERLKDRKPSYRQRVARSVERFVAFLRGDIAIEAVTPETFKRYKDWHLDCNRGAPASGYEDIVCVRKIVVAAGRMDLRASRMRAAPKQIDPSTMPMEIGKFFEEVYRSQKSLQANTEQQMAIALKDLNRFRRRPTLFEELPGVINGWIQSMELKLSPVTCKKRRAAVISIWKLAAANGICPPPNTEVIRKPKTTRPTPDAWTHEEMRSLVEACRMLRGQFYANGIDRGRWWQAFVLVCYDTALRRGDMLALRRPQIERSASGCVLRIVQHKTGDGVIRGLRPATVAAVDAIFPPEREIIFDWPHSVFTLHDHWKHIVAHAGMDPLDRRNGVQKIRRTSASHLERIKPGAATAHLGHRSADMAQKHYLDPKISRGDLPMPPDLGVA